jgi:hypothetical protein
MKRSIPASAPSRRGSVLLLSLIAILIVAAVSLSLTRTLLLQSSHLALRQEKDQADLLALAGLEQVNSLLQKQPERTEFDWDVPLVDPGQRGHVHARVVAADRAARQIVVTAVIHSGNQESTQTTLARRLTAK